MWTKTAIAELSEEMTHCHSKLKWIRTVTGFIEIKKSSSLRFFITWVSEG